MAEPAAETAQTPSTTASPAAAEPRPLRILSANLWNEGADPEAFARLVADVGADVVAVQEAGPRQADALREVLPHGDVEPRLDYHGMGILAREPVGLERIEAPYRGFWIARVGGADPGGQAGAPDGLEVVNVHLAAPHVGPYLPWPRGLRMRRAQLRVLDAYFADRPARARVLVGDLNATPLWPAYRRVTAHLEDAALEVAQRRGRPRLEPTWSRRPNGRRLLRIDHGLARGVHVVDFLVVPIVRSDHAAILMDVLPASDPVVDAGPFPGASADDR